MKRARFAVAAGALWGLAAIAASAPPEDVRTPGVDATRASVSKWVEVQQLLSREKHDWQVAKELLEQRIRLTEGEVSAIEEKVRQAERGLAETGGKRRELASRRESLRAASNRLAQAIGPLESRTREVVSTLPESLQEKLAPLSRRIPADPAATKLSLSERYQSVIGILNEVDRFHHDVTVIHEIRTLSTGVTSEVTTIYLGLGQAFYVTADGGSAGVGHPAAGGWRWTPANELAGSISEVLAILRNEHVPAYVPLPVSIR